jgi:hypothetical protein
VRGFETIYFPAQRIHFARDNPRADADVIVNNHPKLGSGDERLRKTQRRALKHSGRQRWICSMVWVTRTTYTGREAGVSTAL